MTTDKLSIKNRIISHPAIIYTYDKNWGIFSNNNKKTILGSNVSWTYFWEIYSAKKKSNYTILMLGSFFVEYFGETPQSVCLNMNQINMLASCVPNYPWGWTSDIKSHIVNSSGPFSFTFFHHIPPYSSLCQSGQS